MRYPFDKFKLGTKFGSKGTYWKCGYHSGLDLLSANYGGDGIIHPLYPGKVTTISFNHKSYGNYVMVTHDDGYVTLYAHMSKILVTRNQVVSSDTKLGIEGATGNVTGKHLHLEVHKNRYSYPSTIDPLKFITDRLPKEDTEVKKSIKINLNGTIKTVTAIESDGNNYVKLQDLRDSKITVDYDAQNNLPVVRVNK